MTKSSDEATPIPVRYRQTVLEMVETYRRGRMNYLDGRKAGEHTLVKSKNSGETVHPHRGHETLHELVQAPTPDKWPACPGGRDPNEFCGCILRESSQVLPRSGSDGPQANFRQTRFLQDSTYAISELQKTLGACFVNSRAAERQSIESKGRGYVTKVSSAKGSAPIPSRAHLRFRCRSSQRRCLRIGDRHRPAPP